MTDQPSAPDEARETPHHVDLRVERGNPTAEELAALIAVLGNAAGGPTEPTVPERNLWGHPVDKLRYPKFSWQRVTLLERTHLRR
jgi:Acyl-CoA carboxylase epsilon subunit